MSANYTKLASSILTSTIWMEDDHTRIVWFAMMAMADRNGEVQASIPGLANVARVPVESCRAAIAKFLSPDADSRTKDDEGRRIEEIKGGWLLINHAEYRDLASGEDRKRKAAERQDRWRDRKSRNEEVTTSNASVTPESRLVTLSNASSHPVTPESRQICQAEAEAEAEAEATFQSKDMSGKPDVSPLPEKANRFEEEKPILKLLNELTGSKFRNVESNLSLIAARLSEPDVDVEGVKLMVQRQVAKWKTDPKMVDFLRPETLFGKQKFDGYYAARELPINHDSNHAGTRGQRAPSPSATRNGAIAGLDEWRRDAAAADAARVDEDPPHP